MGRWLGLVMAWRGGGVLRWGGGGGDGCPGGGVGGGGELSGEVVFGF